MTMAMKMKPATALVAFLLLTTPVTARGADESVSAARDLYAAAAYDDALVMLDRLRTGAQSPGSQLVIDQYRAFCLLALGRTGDAQQAIEAVVAAEPSFTPSSAEVSPRVRSAFSDVRKKMLPGIIQERYTRAKAAYDRKEYALASTAFQGVLSALSDPDVGTATSRPPLSDIKTLAAGFHELSVAAATPPPAPEPVAAVLEETVASLEAAIPAPAPVVTRLGRTFGPDDTDVVPPAVVKQRLPSFDARVAKAVRPGVLEVVIDEVGAVESAALRASVHPTYDPLLLEAARAWRYKPATVDGQPVKYRKIIAIAVK